MVDLAGQRLGRYEMTARVGAGGMGVVYRARDAQLGREVAVKVLSEHAASRPDRIHRFEQEARAVARLSHPNILAIHDFGSDDGTAYVVTELLRGQTLQDRLRKGPLPLRKALEVGRAIAQGLSAAHGAGIIHRDLKPSNIFITDAGQVKILDFGVARLREEPAEDPVAAIEDSTDSMTAAGHIVGTVGYMSPEQIEGRAVDARSDIFALGCVLYEILTGQRAFKGESASDTTLAILGREPEPMSDLLDDIPPAVELVVRRCLEKQPGERFESARDVAFALKILSDARETPSGVRGGRLRSRRGRFAGKTRRSARSRRMLWTAVAAAAVAAALAAASALTGRWWSPVIIPTAQHLAVVRFEATGDRPENAAFAAGLGESIASALTLLEEQTSGAMWLYPKPVDSAAGLADTARSYAVNIGLKGAIRRQEDLVRLTLTLVDPATGKELGQRIIDDHWANLEAWQARPILEVADMLGLQVLPETATRLEARSTNVALAFESFLRGLGAARLAGADGPADAGVEELRAAVALDPAFIPAKVALARSLRRQYDESGDAELIEAAVDQAQRAASAARDPCDALLTLADLQSAAQNTERRVHALQRATEACPDRAEVHVQLGRTYQALDRPDDAESELQRAVYLRPGFWPGHFWLARLHLSTGATEQAAVQFRHAVENAPENSVGYINLAYVYDQLGRQDEARAALERSIELEPENNPGAFQNLGKIYFDEARFADAADMFERSLKLRPDYYLTWSNLAYAFASGVDADRVEPVARRAIELTREELTSNPGDPDLLSHLASLHALVGETEQGIQLLEEAIEAAPTDARTVAAIAGTWEDLGERERALEWVERAFEMGVPASRFEDRPLLRGLVADEQYQRLASHRSDR